MGKKRADPSLKGKKPINTAKKRPAATSATATKSKPMRNPSHITNRLKRSEMYGKYLQQKSIEKKKRRLQRAKDAEELGDEDAAAAGIKKATPKTLDNTREIDPTMVQKGDEEIQADEADDEFAPYFESSTPPKVLVTTRPRPSQNLFYFIADLQKLIPALHFYPRKSFSLKEICQFATNRSFTHLIVLSENSKQCNGMTISHLGCYTNAAAAATGDSDGSSQSSAAVHRVGPTAFFKVSNVVTSQSIPNHGSSTNHIPELNLHGFGTRLGHRVGRLLGSLFPHDAELQGRQIVTFHNQRDYIFIRHHRYIFEDKKLSKKQQEELDKKQSIELKDKVKARLQELGPRFTLKMRWLQEGSFDTQFGEYEWIHKRKEMDTTRRRFHL